MVSGMNGIARALSDGQTASQGEYEANNILLTGGAGFIASHVVIRLVQRYPEATVSCTAVFNGIQRAFRGPCMRWHQLPNERELCGNT